MSTTDMRINKVKHIHTREYYLALKSKEILTHATVDKTWKQHAKWDMLYTEKT